MNTRKLIALIAVFAMLLGCLPIGAGAKTEFEAERDEPEKTVGTGGTVIDSDGSDGYTGDYVLIYNASTSKDTAYSTGTLTGLISTEVEVPAGKGPERSDPDELYIADVDAELAEQERAQNPDYGRIEESGGVRESFAVGSTRDFYVPSKYNPGSGTSLNFKVLAVGSHCYIWTPSANLTNYYTLDSIDPSYAGQAASEFDRMYDLMNSSFGSHSNGSNGDGRVSLLFFNIQDSYEPGVVSQYTAGFFSSSSYSYDGMPVINLDTYPGIYKTPVNGEPYSTMQGAYGTACHEYQHCINYSNTSGMNSWLNECFSAAAEEICYPGSSVVSRIQSWEAYKFTVNNDWLDPPTEFEYHSDYALHTGFSMYTWDKSITDLLALYGQVSLFSQYLYTRFGNTIFKSISQNFSTSSGEASAISNGTGVGCATLVRDFRLALIANDPIAYNGKYGFVPQADYDPAKYHNVENPYNLLGPVVFTGASCSIAGGGYICVKPVGGVYYPPSNASSNLYYYGITRNLGPQAVESASIAPEELTLLRGASAQLELTVQPFCTDHTVAWSSGDESVATVAGGRVTALAEGETTICAEVYDNVSQSTFRAYAQITVEIPEYVYVPTDTVEEGVEYLIGFDTGEGVKLLMNYNPDPAANTNVNNHYFGVSGSYYGYGVGAVVDTEGRVLAADVSVYPDAGIQHAEWIFAQTDTGYTINSAYEQNYRLAIYNTAQYEDLFPYNGSSANYSSACWQWDGASHTLSNINGTLNKYAAYLPEAEGCSCLFRAVTEPDAEYGEIRLYKKTATAEEPQLLIGDANLDGALSFADVTALYQLLMFGGMNETLYYVCDVTGDGTVSFADVSALYSLLLSGS